MTKVFQSRTQDIKDGITGHGTVSQLGNTLDLNLMEDLKYTISVLMVAMEHLHWHLQIFAAAQYLQVDVLDLKQRN